MATTVNGLDFFSRGEPLAVAEPASGTTGSFDYFSRGEPFGVYTPAAPPPPPVDPQMWLTRPIWQPAGG